MKLPPQIDEIVHPDHEALDTLWPGVDQNFFQPSRRSPSFYLTLGFMGGAIVSLVLCGAYLFVSHLVSASAGDGKKIVVAGSQEAQKEARTAVVDGSEVLIPAFTSYEVKSGDTLAGIALKAYKRVSPRMLDAICKANNMRSAHVLSLGQRLVLPQYHPQYHPQTGNIASGAASPSM